MDNSFVCNTIDDCGDASDELRCKANPINPACTSKSACKTAVQGIPAKKTFSQIGTIISHLVSEGTEFFTEGSGEDMEAITEVEGSGEERSGVDNMVQLDEEMLAVIEEIGNMRNDNESEKNIMEDLEVNGS